MNTIEKNKIIAEFLGLEREQTISNKNVYARQERKNHLKENDVQINFYEESELLYHFSWDWLMEVIVKIFTVEELIKDDLIFKLNDALLEINKDSLYNTCIKCVKWYNEQNK